MSSSPLPQQGSSQSASVTRLGRGSLAAMRQTEVEAGWAALAGASACLAGLILDSSGVLDEAIDEPARTQVKAALVDARAARDTLADAFHREALRLGVALFDLDANREYTSVLELRVVVRDGLAGADGLADVFSLDNGDLVPLASRLRDGFDGVARHSNKEVQEITERPSGFVGNPRQRKQRRDTEDALPADSLTCVNVPEGTAPEQAALPSRRVTVETAPTGRRASARFAADASGWAPTRASPTTTLRPPRSRRRSRAVPTCVASIDTDSSSVGVGGLGYTVSVWYALAVRISIGITSSARACVAPRTMGEAQPAR